MTISTYIDELTNFATLAEQSAVFLEKEGDAATSAKLRQLANTAKSGRLETVIAFCGLFSAGKSSLLNTLCGDLMLATGAVPTTAEVTAVYLPHTDKRVVLLDTPGVDSTDAAHQEATMDALYQADIVALVMDYQHVEAEENLSLARQFSEEGKRIVVIVNQIDKHLEMELSFADFTARVYQTLDDFGIAAERVFFTSSEDTLNNEVEDLATWLSQCANVDVDSYVERLHARMGELIAKHVKEVLAPAFDVHLGKIADLCGVAPYDVGEARAWLAERQTARAELQVALAEQSAAQQAEQSVRREGWLRIIELAQISPYETTERGRLYVESLRSDFKVGWLNAKQKTQAEQERRLSAFVDDLANRAETFLRLPLVNAIRTDLQGAPYVDGAWMRDVETIRFEVTNEIVAAQVKSGALVSSQYPYQFVKDVVTHVKRQFIGQLTHLADIWFHAAAKQLEDEEQGRRTQLQQLTEACAALTDYMQLSEARDARVTLLMSGGGMPA